MRLVVGMSGWEPQWQLILGQIGVSVEQIPAAGKIAPDDYSTIIVARRDDRLRDALLKYLTEGGSLLLEADVGSWLFGMHTVRAFVNTIDPANDPVFEGIMPGFIDASLLLPRKATLLESGAGKKIARILTASKGTALILPGQITKGVLDTKVRRRNFPSRGPHLPSERVARRSKNTIREIIQRSLEYLHFVRSIPFVSLWPFPRGEKSVFALRIDTDFASEQQIDSLYQLLREHNVPGTWFVETQSAQDRIGQFANMEGQEIGVHCYRHKVYRNYFDNQADIKKGRGIVSREDIAVQGYAAPYGEWNVALAKAIEYEGFAYSSEFTLDYDNLPFYPYLGGRFSPVLQIPIHPISTSRLRNARHSEEERQDYFADLVRERIAHGLPIFIYDHPSSVNLKVLNWSLKFIRAKAITGVTMKEYAQWWKLRQTIRWIPRHDESRIFIDSRQPETSIWLFAKRNSLDWTVIGMKDVIDLRAVRWQRKQTSTVASAPIFLRSQLNRKMVLNDLFHYYGKLRQ